MVVHRHMCIVFFVKFTNSNDLVDLNHSYHYTMVTRNHCYWLI